MSVFRNKSEILLLEPCDGKLSRTVLRGESARKGADLPAPVVIDCFDIVMGNTIFALFVAVPAIGVVFPVVHIHSTAFGTNP